MRRNPIDFHLRGRLILVVGGGAGLAPALELLLGAGAFVRVVAKQVDDALQDTFRGGCGIWERRDFAPRDLHHAALAVIATGNVERDLQLARAARASRVPVALPDRPDFSDFALGPPESDTGVPRDRAPRAGAVSQQATSL